MSKKRSSAAGINRSTKVTLMSCAVFIVLTCLTLIFFVLFPITPSEKIMASIGRENILNGDNGNGSVSAVPAVVTTSENGKKPVSTAPTTVKTRHTTTKTVKIVITTGSGFLWNGRIPTVANPNSSYPTTVVDDPVGPVYDPGYVAPTIPYFPGGVTDPGTEDPSAADPNQGGTGWVEPGTGGGENPVDPVIPEPSAGGGDEPTPAIPPSGGDTPVDPNPGGNTPPPPPPDVPDNGGGDSGAGTGGEPPADPAY